MKTILKAFLILLAISVSFSCAKKKEDPYVRCKIIFNFDENGHRVNGFWDIDRNYEVNASACDEVWPTGLPD